MAYSNNNRNYSNNNNFSNNNEPQYKKSGSNYSKIKKGMKEGFFHISAWKTSQNGLITLSAFPALDYNDKREPQGVTEHQSEKGNTFIRYSVIIRQGVAETKKYALFNTKTKMLVISDLNLVVSPNGRGRTKSGKTVTGYFGKIK